MRVPTGSKFLAQGVSAESRPQQRPQQQPPNSMWHPSRIMGWELPAPKPSFNLGLGLQGAWQCERLFLQLIDPRRAQP